MSGLVVIYTTFASLKEAKKISEELLNGKLIACVNIFPEVNSLYLWEEKIHSNCEVIAIMKSRKNKVNKIVKKIEAMHSYVKPAVLILPTESTNKSFSNWVTNVISE